MKDLTLGFEKFKARTRALVEHSFHIVKSLFKYRKVRYRGIKKNTQTHRPARNTAKPIQRHLKSLQ